MSLVVIEDGAAVPEQCRGGAVGIGLFDGVHLGHQALILRVCAEAGGAGVPAGLVTFDVDPDGVAGSDSPPRVLTTLRQRLDLFEKLGVEFVRVVSIQAARPAHTPEAFAATVLHDEVAATAVVIGEGFRCGPLPGVGAKSLGEKAAELGFELTVMPLVAASGSARPLSSDMVRDLLAAGDVSGAAHLLGRPYEVRGVVEHGDQRGRTLGFPTANVAVGGEVMLPVDGVYAALYVTPDGIERPAAASIGRRPTFYEDNGLLLVEAFLLDFDGDLYGQQASVRVTDFIRGQERFASADELVTQMTRDVADVRVALHLP